MSFQQGPIKRTVDPADVPYTFGPVYDTNGFYPANVVELGDLYIMRSKRGVVVDVNPAVQPGHSYASCLQEHDRPGIPDWSSRPQHLSQADQSKVSGSAFHAMYKNQFLNYQRDLRYDPIASEGDLLVICHDAWMEMQPFVDHKNGIGISGMIGISQIGNSSTSIMNYIESMYANSDLVYILLVGDVAQIASPTVPLENGRSDPSYSLMTADSYPDTIIGRFSAESAADVATQVERVLTFENDNWTQDPYYKRALGIGSAEGSGIGDDGESDPVHLGYIMDDLDDYGYTSTGLIVDPNGTVAQGVAALEAGLGTIAYCGHGSATCFGNGSTICVSDIVLKHGHDAMDHQCRLRQRSVRRGHLLRRGLAAGQQWRHPDRRHGDLRLLREPVLGRAHVRRRRGLRPLHIGVLCHIRSALLRRLLPDDGRVRHQWRRHVRDMAHLR